MGTERRKPGGEIRKLQREKAAEGKSGRRKTRSGGSRLAETGGSEKPALAGGLELDPGGGVGRGGGGLELDSGGRVARGRDEENKSVVGAGHDEGAGFGRRKGAGGTAGKPGIHR